MSEQLIWIVFNKCANADMLPYGEQTKVFTDYDKATAFAKSIGLTDPFGMGVTRKPGVQTVEMYGDVHVEVLCTFLD